MVYFRTQNPNFTQIGIFGLKINQTILGGLGMENVNDPAEYLRPFRIIYDRLV
jgi:hypothetical protein